MVCRATWQSRLTGSDDDAVVELLAIRSRGVLLAADISDVNSSELEAWVDPSAHDVAQIWTACNRRS